MREVVNAARSVDVPACIIYYYLVYYTSTTLLLIGARHDGGVPKGTIYTCI